MSPDNQEPNSRPTRRLRKLRVESESQCVWRPGSCSVPLRIWPKTIPEIRSQTPQPENVGNQTPGEPVCRIRCFFRVNAIPAASVLLHSRERRTRTILGRDNCRGRRLFIKFSVQLPLKSKFCIGTRAGRANGLLLGLALSPKAFLAIQLV